ncbi:phage scaffolding protein [Priestia flexa]|uniref:phage scaffolding protein n=1 Tax=Priestia flexa TaxID=86664 RepID=UPI000473B28F|nr:phage scaffolding protein [Priestia flexa]
MKELLEALAKGEKQVDEVLQAIETEQKNMVPRFRLNDKNDEIKDLKQQLGDRDTQLADLKNKAVGNEELQNQIKTLQDANQTAKDEYEAKLTKQAYDFALDKELLTAKARNPKAVKALLDMETIKLDGDSLLGLSEQLTKLQESDGYLFDVESGQSGGSGYNPGGGKMNPPPPPPNPQEAGRQRALARHSKEEN